MRVFRFFFALFSKRARESGGDDDDDDDDDDDPSIRSSSRTPPPTTTPNTGTKTGGNGTLEFVLLAYNGTALDLSPCPPTPADDEADDAAAAAAPDEAAAAAAAAAAVAAAAAASIEVEILFAPQDAGPVALPYSNETVVIPAGGWKWSVDVQRWPFCSVNNTLALDVVLRGEDTFDAAPRVYGGVGSSIDGGSGVENDDAVSFGDGLYLPRGLGSGGVLGGADEGDNDDDDDEAGAAEWAAGGAAAAAGAAACAGALQALGNATDGGGLWGEAPAALSPAWLMPSARTPFSAAAGFFNGSDSLVPASQPPAVARRALLQAANGNSSVPLPPRVGTFNCADRAAKQRARLAEAAAARLAAIEAAVAAAVNASSSSGNSSSSSSSSSAAEASSPMPSRKLLRERPSAQPAKGTGGAITAAAAAAKKKNRDDNNNSRNPRAAAALAAAAVAARARLEMPEPSPAALSARASAAAAAASAVAAVRDACATPSALMAAKRALRMPPIRARARPGTPLDDALAAADAAATAAAFSSPAAVAAAVDVAGDVLCPAAAGALSARVANVSGLGVVNGAVRPRPRPPARGRLATLLLSGGVAAKLELPAYAVDGDPTDPSALQMPVAVLVLPDAEDASTAVTRYLFTKPRSPAARIHYDPTAGAGAADSAYLAEEIQDAASAPVPTFDAAFMSDEAAQTGTAAGGDDPAAGDGAAGQNRAKSSASAARVAASAAAGATMLVLLLVV